MKAPAGRLNKEFGGTGFRPHFISDYYYSTAPEKPTDNSPYDLFLLAQGEKKEAIGSHAGIRDTSTLMALELLLYRKGQLIRWDKRSPAQPGDGVSGNPTHAKVEYGQKDWSRRSTRPSSRSEPPRSVGRIGRTGRIGRIG